MEINWFWQSFVQHLHCLITVFYKSIKNYVYKFMFTNNIETTVHAYINVYIFISIIVDTGKLLELSILDLLNNSPLLHPSSCRVKYKMTQYVFH